MGDRGNAAGRVRAGMTGSEGGFLAERSGASLVGVSNIRVSKGRVSLMGADGSKMYIDRADMARTIQNAMRAFRSDRGGIVLHNGGRKPTGNRAGADPGRLFGAGKNTPRLMNLNPNQAGQLQRAMGRAFPSMAAKPAGPAPGGGGGARGGGRGGARQGGINTPGFRKELAKLQRDARRRDQAAMLRGPRWGGPGGLGTRPGAPRGPITAP